MGYYNPKWLAWSGILASIINSFAFPVYGFLFAKILFVMMDPYSPTYDRDRNFWCGMFLLLCVLLGLFAFLQKYIFLYVGEILTFDIRDLLFRGIIYKQIAWFDNKDRAPGVLSNVLSEDIACLNGMTTEHFAILLEAFLSLIIGIVIALFFTWRMGLVTIAMIPFVMIGGWLTSRLAWKVKPGKTQSDQTVDDPYKKSNALLSDILMNYRTVIGFGEKNVNYLLKNFDVLLE